MMREQRTRLLAACMLAAIALATVAFALSGEQGLVVVLCSFWLGLALAPYKRGAQGWVNATSVAVGRRVIWGAAPSTLTLGAHEGPAIRKILLLLGAGLLVWLLSPVAFEMWLGE